MAFLFPWHSLFANDTAAHSAAGVTGGLAVVVTAYTQAGAAARSKMRVAGAIKKITQAQIIFASVHNNGATNDAVVARQLNVQATKRQKVLRRTSATTTQKKT